MKKRNLIAALLIAVMLLTVGCGKNEKPVVYSNLTEDSIRYDLDSLLKAAGVSDQQRFILFDHVDQFNEIMYSDNLTHGFEPLGIPKYDPYLLQERWDRKHPDFMGYNCRITAFSLMDGLGIKMPENVENLGEIMLEFDMAALACDSSAFSGKTDRFLAFFSQVPTENTRDVKTHVKNLLGSWQQRGIGFVNQPEIRMINVVFHNQMDGENTLLIGHSGILLPTPDGELWFLEKLGFQEPYQLVVFQSRKQLETYLMEKYDLDQNQPTAKPFIMENDQLMKS